MIVPLTPLEFRHRGATYYSDRTGVIDGPYRFTWGEFDQRVNQLAAGLRGVGIQKPETVSYLSVNSYHLLEGYYGVLQAGGLLNPLFPGLDVADVIEQLNHASTKLLFFHAGLLPLVEGIRSKLPLVRQYVIIEPRESVAWAVDYESFLSSAADVRPADLDAINENDPAELFYYKGRQGGLRGVMLTHRTLYLHALGNMCQGALNKDDVLLCAVPLFSANGWATPHYAPAVGGRLVLLRDTGVDSILRTIEREKVTQFYAWPALVNAIVRHPTLKNFDLDSLQVIILGGADVHKTLIRSLQDELQCRVQVGYGQTEGSPTLVGSGFVETLSGEEDSVLARHPSGIPLVGVRIRVVDEKGNDVPRDDTTPGEVLARSNFIMAGYLKRPELNREKLVDGWFYTGDLATVNALGEITIVGQTTDR